MGGGAMMISIGLPEILILAVVVVVAVVLAVKFFSAAS
jgi:hypothetical protein